MNKKNKISFPSFEISNYQKNLAKWGVLSTHRIRDEYNKYKLGKIYYHPKLGFLKVVSITKMINIKYSPAYKWIKEWTEEQQSQLKKSKKIEYLVLEKVITE
jgi:hypothetical protein